MPKIKSIIVSLVLSFTFSLSGKEIVVTSFYPLYLSAANLLAGVESVEVKNMTQTAAGCLHDYTLTTMDMKNLAHGTIFFINGSGMESFVPKVVKNLPKLKIVDTSKGFPLLDNNSHIWLSEQGVLHQLVIMKDALVTHFPTERQKITQNYQSYSNQLHSLWTNMKSQLAPYKNREILTFHEAFPYFAHELSLKLAATIEREPGDMPSAKELKELVKLINTKNIRAIFAEPQYPSKAADTLARETKAKVYILDPIVTGDFARIDNYLVVMNKNLEVLKEALSK